MSKIHVKIGILGPEGHGKRTLMSAITRIQSARGQGNFASRDEISRSGEGTEPWSGRHYGAVEFRTENRPYVLMNCPNLSDYLRNFITGAVQMDGVLLVVSAADGPGPQTQEHLGLAFQTDLPHLVVFMNEVDLVEDPQLVEWVEQEIRHRLGQNQFPEEKVPVLRGSAQRALECGCGQRSCEWCGRILGLLDSLDERIPDPVPEVERPFLMPIEEVFNIQGRGPVICGRLERGVIRTGDEMEIVGLRETQRSVVVGLERFRNLVEEGRAGDHLGVLLQGIERTEVEQGQVIAQPGTIAAHRKFQGWVYVLTREQGGLRTPFFSGYQPRFFFRTKDVAGRVEIPRCIEVVMPGDMVKITGRLELPMAMEKRQHFAMREAIHLEGKRILRGMAGAGIVTEVLDGLVSWDRAL